MLDRFGDRMDAGSVEVLSLLLTELVTNSIRHAGMDPNDWIEVVVHLEEDKIRVEVSDKGCRLVRTRLADPVIRTGGWGLVLVSRLADRWGVIPSSSDAKTVWFELDGMFRAVPHLSASSRP